MMIPAGYEKKSKYNDYESDNYDDEDFVFDFNDNKSNSPEEPIVSTLKSSASYADSFDNASEKPNVVYEMKNDYYYDEMDLIRDDIRNAVIHKNLTLLKELLQKHTLEVDCVLRTNWTPLMYAVSCGSYEITEYLICEGADVQYTDESFSVLLCASGCIDPNVNPQDLVRIIKLLVKNGADVNSYDKYYQTPLMYACRSNNILLIESLVDLHADINAQDDNEWTALSHASSKGHLKCVHKLLKLGADPSIYTYDYLYPFDLAQNSGFTEVKQLIKRFIRVKKNENIKNNVTDSALAEIKTDEEFESFEDEDDGLVYGLRKSLPNDLEVFLNAIKLPSLITVFKKNGITMNKLLNFDETDLIKLGISDKYICELILYEVTKFHKKNWKSSGLVPIRKDCQINCNEVIAIVSNLTRHTDYMSTNIKYITSETKKSNCDLFTDKFLSSRLLLELKDTLKNSRTLLNNVENYCGFVEKFVSDTKASPIDSIKPKKRTLFTNPFKLAAMSTVGIACVASTIFYVKRLL